MLNFAILILNISLSNYLHVLPKKLNAKNVFLFFGVMAREGIKYVLIAFQSTSIEIP